MSCVNKAITHSIDKIKSNNLKSLHCQRRMYVSDGCTVQFRLGFVFNFLRYFQKDVALELHYNEAHHGKGLMDGIGGIIRNLVYRKVLSRDVVFDTPKKFAGFANEISNVDFLFFLKEQLFTEGEEVAKAAQISTTSNIHKVKLVKKGNSFKNKFCYLSEGLESFFAQKYGVQYGHKATGISDENICNHCEDEYVAGEEWIQCPICTHRYHRKCFYE